MGGGGEVMAVCVVMGEGGEMRFESLWKDGNGRWVVMSVRACVLGIKGFEGRPAPKPRPTGSIDDAELCACVCAVESGVWLL